MTDRNREKIGLKGGENSSAQYFFLICGFHNGAVGNSAISEHLEREFNNETTPALAAARSWGWQSDHLLAPEAQINACRTGWTTEWWRERNLNWSSRQGEIPWLNLWVFPITVKSLNSKKIVFPPLSLPVGEEGHPQKVPFGASLSPSCHFLSSSP